MKIFEQNFWEHWIKSRSALIWALSIGFFIGLIWAFPGANTWDDKVQESHTHWLLSHYGGLAPRDYLLPYDQLYGPLWSLVLGLLYLPFRFFQDESLFRHAFTFALYPVSLLFTARLLLKAGLKFSTVLLCCAMIFGIVRLGGHAILNVKDFPHAMAFLVVSIYLWVKLREGFDIWTLSAVSLIPFLLRTPLLFHFAGLWFFTLSYVLLVKHNFSTKQIFKLLGAPWAVLVASAVIFFPVIWQAGPKPWVHMFIFFNSVYTDGSVRIFGTDYLSQALPRWYALVWIPIISTPPAFMALVLGIPSLVFARTTAKDFNLDTHFGRINISLKSWLLIIFLGASATLVLKAPRLYDEERHIMFLYPLLFLLGGLGLDWLSCRKKFLLSLVIVIWACYDLGSWGLYSYIYKSPLVGQTKAADFMGDYWGVCLNQLVLDREKAFPENGLQVEIPMAMDVVNLQRERIVKSLMFKNSAWREIPAVSRAEGNKFYLALIQRQADLTVSRLYPQVELNPVYQVDMPKNQGPACVVYMGYRQ